jgi:uncharacterized protein YbdZ (MbtH family)
MNDWRIVEGHWINFSKMNEIYVIKVSEDQYSIWTTDIVDAWQLFDRYFNTHEAAQIYLDKVMNGEIR